MADDFATGKVGKTSDSLPPSVRVHGTYALWKDTLYVGLGARLGRGRSSPTIAAV